MTITKASRSDLGHLLNLARRFHALGPYRDRPFDEDLLTEYLVSFFDRADARIYMTNRGAIGMSIESAEVYKTPFVRERFFYAEKGEGAELLEMLDHFSDQNGNLPITLSALSQDGKDTRLHTRLYGRRGYRVAETTYIKGF